MAVKTKNKPITRSLFKKTSNSDIENEIKAVREILDFKTQQTINPELQKPIETPETPSETPLETTSEVNQPETPSEPVNTSEAHKITIGEDLSEATQEDFDKKDTAQAVNDFVNSDNITDRVEGLTLDDFPTNEGATEEEDTPEYRREMSKIKASAMVEFFDVIFMLICLVISKDFSDKNQEKFTLVKARKNSIKANVFQIMAFSKKKHNPMGTLIFLIIFSYVPLIVMAVMERIKSKKAEQEKQKEDLLRQEQMYLQSQNNINTPFNNVTPYQPEVKTEKRGRPKKEKLITIEKGTGMQVKLMKDGSYKNLTTGQTYTGGRGRQPSWVKQYIGKLG